MSDSEHKYFNFPIILLEGFLNDSNTCLINIIDYSLYKFSVKTECYIDKESFRNSVDYFKVKLGDYERTYTNGKMLYDSLDVKLPKASIEFDMYFDFYKNYKTEFEKVCLLAFIALRSIIGRKLYCQTTENFLLARMDGKTNAINELHELSPEILTYASRRKLDKIKTELTMNWNLRYYSYYMRGFYISFKLDILLLIENAQNKRPGFLERMHKRNLKDARESVRKKLNVQH